MSIALALELAGAAMLLLAYFGLQARIWREIDDRFLLLNVAGAALLAAVAWADWRLGFAILNTVWCLAAIRSSLSLRFGDDG